MLKESFRRRLEEEIWLEEIKMETWKRAEKKLARLSEGDPVKLKFKSLRHCVGLVPNLKQRLEIMRL